MSIPTPHISSKTGDFANTVLMPGDPLRAKFIAENFLTNAVLINDVRGIGGYTGTFDGVRISLWQVVWNAFYGDLFIRAF